MFDRISRKAHVFRLHQQEIPPCCSNLDYWLDIYEIHAGMLSTEQTQRPTGQANPTTVTGKAMKQVFWEITHKYVKDNKAAS